MKITTFTPSNLGPADFNVYVSKFVGEVITALNNGLLIQDNMSFKTISVTFTVANQEVKIDHNLGRTPLGYVSIGQSAALTVYDGTTETTSQSIYLRSSAVGTVKLLIV